MVADIAGVTGGLFLDTDNVLLHYGIKLSYQFNFFQKIAIWWWEHFSLCPLSAKSLTASDWTIAVDVSEPLFILTSQPPEVSSHAHQWSPPFLSSLPSLSTFSYKLGVLNCCHVMWAMSLHVSSLSVLNLLNSFSCWKIMYNRNKKGCYTNQLLVIFSPLTNDFLMYWWYLTWPPENLLCQNLRPVSRVTAFIVVEYHTYPVLITL